jgi:hypothetical protein
LAAHEKSHLKNEDWQSKEMFKPTDELEIDLGNESQYMSENEFSSKEIKEQCENEKESV